jgi:hypothetical protein
MIYIDLIIVFLPLLSEIVEIEAIKIILSLAKWGISEVQLFSNRIDPIGIPFPNGIIFGIIHHDGGLVPIL